MSDLIDRQAAIDALFDWEMTYDWDEHCREEDPKPAYIVSPSDVIEQLPSAQPQLEDCPIYGGMCGYPSNLCYECPRHEGTKERPQWWTEGLQPFAQPERMKGRWIPFDIPWYQCSECGAVRENNAFMENFCPNCGADMRGDEDAAD